MGLGDMLGQIYDTMKAKLSEAVITGLLAYAFVAFVLPALRNQQMIPAIPLIGSSGALAVALPSSYGVSAGMAAFYASLLYDVVLGPLGLGNVLSGVM